MARASKTPPLRQHKGTGQGYVTLNNRRIYLGRHDDPATQKRYDRTVAEWLANGRRLPVAPEEITLTELAARYLKHCDEYYRTPDGAHSSELGNVEKAIEAATGLYGDKAAVEFGPVAFKTVRAKWIGDGLSRSTVNRYARNVKRMFRWGVANELIPESAWRALDAVEGLRKGRSAAKESEPVRAIAQAHIDAVKPFVSRQVWGLVRLQLLTGARSGEIVGLRRVDLDTTGKIWFTHLDHHKTSHRGKLRTIYFGPQAQAVLKEFFPGKGPSDYLFSPADAVREMRADAATKDQRRRDNQEPTPRDTDRTVGDHYTTGSYRRAIERGCKAALADAKENRKPEPAEWTPHQLRHVAATRIRKEMGLEAAQVWLGHANADVTQVYAEIDHARALDIAERLG